jgi:maltose 6'-phosphate phosphatase
MFRSLGMDVCWSDLGLDVSGMNSMNHPSSHSKTKGNVIDHVIYDTSKMKTVKEEIIELEKPLSDHKPVWALLELK